MSQNSSAGDVRRPHTVRKRIAVLDQRGDEFVNEMRVRPAMSFERPGIGDEMGVRSIWVGSLAAGEPPIFRQIEKGLRREVADRLGQKLGVIWGGCALRHP